MCPTRLAAGGPWGASMAGALPPLPAVRPGSRPPLHAAPPLIAWIPPQPELWNRGRCGHWTLSWTPAPALTQSDFEPRPPRSPVVRAYPAPSLPSALCTCCSSRRIPGQCGAAPISRAPGTGAELKVPFPRNPLFLGLVWVPSAHQCLVPSGLQLPTGGGARICIRDQAQGGPGDPTRGLRELDSSAYHSPWHTP